MAIKVYGSPAGAVLQSKTRSYAVGEGWTTETRYEGLEADVTRLAAVYKAAGYNVNISNGEGPTRVMTATTKNAQDDAEQVEETWEFPSCEIQLDIMASDLALTLNDATRYDLQLWMDKKLKQHNDFYLYFDKRRVAQIASDKSIRGFLNDTTGPGSPSWVGGYACNVAKLYSMGIKTFFSSEFMVRITRCFSGNYDLKASAANSNKLFTLAQLTTLENPPTATLKYSLPATTSLDSNRFKFAYLRKKPEVSLASDGKWRTVSEYIYGKCSADLYDDATL